MKYQLRMFHPSYGDITTPTFTDIVQFRIFCKMVQGALALKQDLTTYDAQELFIHIPHKVLTECVIVSGVNQPLMTLADYAIKKTESLSND
jgi:hypothetical protein